MKLSVLSLVLSLALTFAKTTTTTTTDDLNLAPRAHEFELAPLSDEFEFAPLVNDDEIETIQMSDYSPLQPRNVAGGCSALRTKNASQSPKGVCGVKALVHARGKAIISVPHISEAACANRCLCKHPRCKSFGWRPHAILGASAGLCTIFSVPPNELGLQLGAAVSANVNVQLIFARNCFSPQVTTTTTSSTASPTLMTTMPAQATAPSKKVKKHPKLDNIVLGALSGI